MVPPGRRSLRRGAARARRLATPVRALRNSSGGVDLSKDLRGQTPAARPQRSKLPPAGGTTDATTGPLRRLPARPCRSALWHRTVRPRFGRAARCVTRHDGGARSRAVRNCHGSRSPPPPAARVSQGRFGRPDCGALLVSGSSHHGPGRLTVAVHQGASAWCRWLRRGSSSLSCATTERSVSCNARS